MGRKKQGPPGDFLIPRKQQVGVYVSPGRVFWSDLSGFYDERGAISVLIHV